MSDPIAILEELVQEIANGAPIDRSRWIERGRAAIETLYGDDSTKLRRFAALSRPSIVRSPHSVRSGTYTQAEVDALVRAAAMLDAIIETHSSTTNVNVGQTSEPQRASSWLTDEGPVLQAILDRENEGQPLRFTELVEVVGGEPARVEASVRALLDGHIVMGIDATTFGGFEVLELRLTAAGRSVLRQVDEMRPSQDQQAHSAEIGDQVAISDNVTAVITRVVGLPEVAEFDFDVAVSYSRADEGSVQPVVDAMKAEGISVWIDKDHEADLWGSNLETAFADVFASKARYVMVFLSQTYKERDWTRFELDVAQSASRTRETAYVLPVIVDTHVPAVVGISRTVGFVSLRDHSPEEIARLLHEKIATPDS